MNCLDQIVMLIFKIKFITYQAQLLRSKKFNIPQAAKLRSVCVCVCLQLSKNLSQISNNLVYNPIKYFQITLEEVILSALLTIWPGPSVFTIRVMSGGRLFVELDIRSHWCQQKLVSNACFYNTFNTKVMLSSNHFLKSTSE